MGNFLKEIATFAQTKLDFFQVGPALSAALFAAVFGVVCVLVGFLIALVIKSSSRVSKTIKNFQDATVFVNTLGEVDELNVDQLNTRIQQMPGSVSAGWGNFLQQQSDYPSDYITEHDVMADTEAVPRFFGASTFFALFSGIAVLLFALLTAIGSYSQTSAADITKMILAVVGGLCLPLLVYLVLSAILKAGRRKQLKKLQVEIRTFQTALDTNVILYREEQDEFISENIEEINATIERILANRLENREIIEIVTTPQVDEELEYEPEEEIFPAFEQEERASETPIAIAEPIEYDSDQTEEEETLDDIVDEDLYEDNLEDDFLFADTEEAEADDADAWTEELFEDEAAEEEVEEELVEEELVEDEPQEEDVVEEELAEEEVLEEEPAEEAVAEEEPEELDAVAAAIAALDENPDQEIPEILIELVHAMDSVVNDPITTISDLETLTYMMVDAEREIGFDTKIEQMIFTACMTIIANEYFGRLDS